MIQPDLVYKDDGHRYTWQGLPVRSVTWVLSSVGTRTGESRWSPVGFDERWVRDDTASEFGVAFHKVAEIILRGGHPGYPEGMEPWVATLRRFLDTYKPMPHQGMVEQPLFSTRMGVAGTPDLLCSISDKLVLIDWKTATSFSSSWYPQTAAYAEMCREALKIRHKIIRWAVRFDSDDWEIFERVNHPEDLNFFQSCNNVLRFSKNQKP